MRFRRFLTPRLVASAVAIVVALAVFGPTFVEPESGLLPPPSDGPATSERQPTTSVDHSSVELPAVAGSVLPSPLVERGKSTIHGSVDVPDGRLPGATVRLERLVGDQVQWIDVATGADGTFRVADVPGGRYRVRAWLAPTFTMAEPEIFFLVDGDEREMHLQLGELEGVVVKSTVAPAAPYVGQGVNISVWVADRVVDVDGFARDQARPGVRVTLSVSGLSAVEPDAVRTTDAAGVAVFEFACTEVGSVAATALVGEAASPSAAPPPDASTPDDEGDVDVIDEVTPIEVPNCAPTPTTTTAPADSDDDAVDDDASPETTDG